MTSVARRSISQQRQEELREAIGDAPIVVLYNLVIQQVFGWPAYLIRNASGQRRYPKMTNREFGTRDDLLDRA